NGTALVYSTYLGGNGGDIGFDISLDAATNAYVVGVTGSANFPLSNALQTTYAGSNDAFVSKLNANGSALVYSTYLGGSDDDQAFGIATDGADNAYVSGATRSTNFPLEKALQATLSGPRDTFITKVDAFSLNFPDLNITKQHSGNFTVGTNGAYTIGVTNVGNLSTTNTITVSDILPTGLGFVSGIGTDWNCSASGQVVTCTRTTALAQNASTNITLTVSVTSGALPGITNTVSVSTSGDQNTGNNMASDVTAVGAPCVQAISIPQTINGVLTTASCRSPIRGNLYYADRYTFSGAAGQGVAVHLSATYDTILYLIGPNNSIIASDDDGGGGTNARIPAGSGFFSLPTSGTYTIEATTYSINQTGAYTLNLSTGLGGGTAPQIISISPPSPITSSVDQSINVFGSNFQQGLTVTAFFPGGGSATLSGSQIKNLTPTSFTMLATLNAQGTWSIRVNNPDGLQSNVFPFFAQPASIQSQIDSISSVSPFSSSNDQSIQVFGSGFSQGLTVSAFFPGGGGALLSGTQIQDVSPTSFTLLITFGSSGTWSIRVNNPNGSQSNTF